MMSMFYLLFIFKEIFFFHSIRVSECYKNEKRIDQSCKQLIAQSNLLIKQSQAWIHLIGQFTVALKVLFSILN